MSVRRGVRNGLLITLVMWSAIIALVAVAKAQDVVWMPEDGGRKWCLYVKEGREFRLVECK